MNFPRLLTLLLALATLPFVTPAHPQPAPAAAPKPAAPYTRTEDVVYGRKFGTALTLDVLQPTAVPANGYGIIALVSGGWRSGHDGVNPPPPPPHPPRPPPPPRSHPHRRTDHPRRRRSRR
ncbi:MAG: hypothetical protein H7343_22635, partial [Undibacterium sp.]|nr:hypothetical protein [Opitutaceae bacterium]